MFYGKCVVREFEKSMRGKSLTFLEAICEYKLVNMSREYYDAEVKCIGVSGSSFRNLKWQF